MAGGVRFGIGTELIVDEAVPAAARMHLSAEDAARKLGPLLSAIRAAEGTKPWGRCQAGEAFEEAYCGPDGSNVDSILDSSEAICGAIAGLTENAGIGALRTEQVDDSIGGQLQQFQDDEQTDWSRFGDHPAVLAPSAGAEPSAGARPEFRSGGQPADG